MVRKSRRLQFNKARLVFVYRYAVTWLKRSYHYVILAGLVGVFFFTPVFKIRDVYVLMDSEEYVTVQDVGLVTDSAVGEPFFMYNPRDLSSGVYSLSPFIKLVSFEKVFPNSLVVRLTFYEPYVRIQGGDNCYLFSSEGILIGNFSVSDCTMYAGSSYLVTYDGGLDNDSYVSQLYTDIDKILKVFQYQGLKVDELRITENNIDVSVGENIFIFDRGEDLDIQLKRLLLVVNTVFQKDYTNFNLHLGFEKPYLEER